VISSDSLWELERGLAGEEKREKGGEEVGQLLRSRHAPSLLNGRHLCRDEERGGKRFLEKEKKGKKKGKGEREDKGEQ